MGCIVLEGMRFRSAVGYYQEERNLKGDFSVDVKIWTDLSDSSVSDDLNETINYETVYKFCDNIMSGEYDLLETVGHLIVQEIKNQWPHINKVSVRVSKWNPPLPGKVERAFIEIEN